MKWRFNVDYIIVEIIIEKSEGRLWFGVPPV